MPHAEQQLLRMLRDWCSCLSRFYITFHDDVKDSDENSGGAQQRAAPVSGLLEKKIGGPLVRVQTALAKETVLWKKGILAMPQVCCCSHSASLHITLCATQRHAGLLFLTFCFIVSYPIMTILYRRSS